MDCVGCDKCKLWGKLQVGWRCSLDFVTGKIVSARGVSPDLQKGTDDSFWGCDVTDQSKNSAMAWAVSPHADTGKNTRGYIKMLGTV